MPASRSRPRSRLAFLAALLAMVGQLGAMWLAPVAEARASHSAPAHVEADGTQSHHSHNPNECAACQSLQQAADAPQESLAEPVAVERHAPDPVAAPSIAAPIRAGPRNPRAPPVSRPAVS